MKPFHLSLKYSPRSVRALSKSRRCGAKTLERRPGFMIEDQDMRDRILAEPETLLEDRDVMNALIGANERLMGGNVVDLKKACDEALALGCPTVEGVIVAKRT
eukprot:gene51230-62641_t